MFKQASVSFQTLHYLSPTAGCRVFHKSKCLQTLSALRFSVDEPQQWRNHCRQLCVDALQMCLSYCYRFQISFKFLALILTKVKTVLRQSFQFTFKRFLCLKKIAKNLKKQRTQKKVKRTAAKKKGCRFWNPALTNHSKVN